MTVVTQFLTSGGQLSEIKRFYVQNGVVFANSNDLLGKGGNSITQDWCTDIRKVFTDYDSFGAKGGLAQMGRGLSNMVLVLSVWNDVSFKPRLCTRSRIIYTDLTIVLFQHALARLQLPRRLYKAWCRSW